METSALFTDFYSLTMAQGYWKNNRKERAVFEMFFRHQPFGGGYSIFAGLAVFLEALKTFRFKDDEIEYLKSLGVFEDGFTEYLKSFKFTGDLWAMDEGTVIFPHEPVIRVESNLVECQLIEGLMLNIINFQTLIATKTCRIWLASGKGKVMEFGLRRAQGPNGAVSASRAAFIGGAFGTSNTMAGKIYGIPVMGTMAHSWIMSFASEEDAFDAYASQYPDGSIFLIDTYDTLNIGIHNAIKVGKKLTEKGKNFGVRLDSGDIQYLSLQVRRHLDDAGLHNAFITVSNDLDENIIETLVKEGAPVNSWGVGTRLVTGGQASAFTGVYKMAAIIDNKKNIPVMKFSDNPEKTTNPGIKQVWRIKDKNGSAISDVLCVDDEEDAPKEGQTYSFWHPSADYRHFKHTIEGEALPLLKKRVEEGVFSFEEKPLAQIKAHAENDLESFDGTYKRLLNPHIYKVSITDKLRALKLELIQKYIGNKH